jgi:hypothetical protein
VPTRWDAIKYNINLFFKKQKLSIFGIRADLPNRPDSSHRFLIRAIRKISTGAAGYKKLFPVWLRPLGSGLCVRNTEKAVVM